MFWYPYTGSIPMALSWSAGLFTTALAIATLAGMARLAVLALRPEQPEAVSVPCDPVPLDEDHEVKQAAA